MTDKPDGKRLGLTIAGWTVVLLLLASFGSAAPPIVKPPQAVNARDDLVKLFGKSIGFGPVQRAEFAQFGRQVFCVWYDPFSGRSACYLHAYYYDPAKRQWILFIDRLVKGPSDLSAEMTRDSLLFKNPQGTVVLKESVSKLPVEKWYGELNGH
jgi:hypothetical protein